MLRDPELIEAFKVCKSLGAVAMVHAENGDLIYEVRIHTHVLYCLYVTVNRIVVVIAYYIHCALCNTMEPRLVYARGGLLDERLIFHHQGMKTNLFA